MSIRETINEKKMVGLMAAVLLLAGAGAIMAYTLWPTGPTIHGKEGFFTDDDGKSYFRGSIYQIPPFDHDGKTANGAIVFSYSKGNFVAYQLRYTPAAKKRLDDAVAKARSDGNFAQLARLLAEGDIAMGGCEIKLPNSNKWISRAASPHPRVTAPDGGDCLMVTP